VKILKRGPVTICPRIPSIKRGGKNMSSISEELILSLEKLGCKAKVVSISHMNEMRDELFALRDSNMIDKKLYKDMLSGMEFNSDNTLNNAKSIIVIAAPQVISKANFEYKGSTYSLSLPPTYVSGDIRSKVKEIMKEISSKNDFKVQGTKLPQKQLAVKSGLAKYGKNNITYIDGMGSFHVLMSFYTDLDLTTDSWQAADVASDCNNCTICLKNCPTGAISDKRFLINAEKCMTFVNEYGDDDFPEWVKPEWHNSLIGCMSCQLKCPKNAAFANKSKVIVSFTEDETIMLLDKVSLESLPEATVKKLDDIEMTSNYSFLGRNINILL
jgi:epoxyqueuosine reductase